MKALTAVVIVATFVALGSCCPGSRQVSSEDRRFFESWKRQYGKSYESYEEEQRAMLNVLAEQSEVEEHNRLYEQGRKTYAIGLNEHSDLSEEEFKLHLLGYDEEDDGQSSRLTHHGHFPPGPDYVNWTAKGLVGPVENQRHCGACWAFSTAGIVNAVQLKKNKNAALVSPQQLIDCDHHVSEILLKMFLNKF
jgi:C1A family cysteine protease